MKQVKIFIEAARKLSTEFLGVVLALIVLGLSPYILRFFDPTAGSYDAGILQILMFAVVGVLSFSFLSWIGIRINFSEIFNYMQVEMMSDLKNLTPWQKILISYGVYFGYLLAFVLMAKVLM